MINTEIGSLNTKYLKGNLGDASNSEFIPGLTDVQSEMIQVPTEIIDGEIKKAVYLPTLDVSKIASGEFDVHLSSIKEAYKLIHKDYFQFVGIYANENNPTIVYFNYQVNRHIEKMLMEIAKREMIVFMFGIGDTNGFDLPYPCPKVFNPNQ